MRLMKKQATVHSTMDDKKTQDEKVPDTNMEIMSEKDTANSTVNNTETVSESPKGKKRSVIAVQQMINRNKKKTEGKEKKNILLVILSKIVAFFLKIKGLITYAGEKTLPVRRQMRFKLVVSFLVPVAFIIILGVFTYSITKNTLRDNYESSAKASIKSTSLYVNLLMDDIQTRTSQLAAEVNFKTYYNTYDTLELTDASEIHDSIEATMKQLKSSSVGIYNIYAFGAKGKPISTQQSLTSDSAYTEFNDSKEADVYKKSAEKKGIVTSAWLGKHETLDKIAEVTDEYYVASYIRNFNKGEGYIICDLLAEKVNEVLKTALVSDGSVTAFVTADGRETVVAGKESPLKDKLKGKNLFAGQSFYKNEIKKDSNGSSNITYKNQKYLFVYSKVGETGAVLCTLIPQSDVLGNLKVTKTVTLILVIISGLIAFFIGLVIATDIGRVINKFSSTFKHVSAGDFTVRINTKRQDEFGVLAHDMDDMLVQIKALVADMANFGHNVSEAAVKVSGASEEILKSINEVSDTVNVMNQGVGEQAKDTEKSFLQMTDFAGQIGEAFDNTTKVGQVANQTQETISSGKNIVDELMQQVTATSEVTSVIIGDIDELQQQSKNIGSVVETINEIASTTNLLSLNASIEAARAGDAGRGFAVVADQIRSLAEQSVESVKRIEKIIKAIQAKTQETVTSAKSAEQMLSSQTEALNNTVQVFQDVDIHMVNLLDKINHINDNMKTITVEKDDVLDAIKNIAAVTQQTLASSEVVESNINTQITSVETLNLQAEEMKEKAKELELAIDKFKI